MTDKPLTPEEAAQELLRRRKARTSLNEHVEFISGKAAPPHIRLLNEKLHLVMKRKITRLMVFMPPGHAKTHSVSWHFPAFYLSQPEYYDHNIIAATHTDKFAEQNGMRVRNIILGDEHAALFPQVKVSEQSSANARWETTRKGTYNGFGVGATVVGRRADGIIMDDVVAGMAAADSQTERDFIWSWYGGDLYTRLKPNGFIILVMTRYHLDDIAGRLLAASSAPHGEKWEVLSLPALAKDNDAMGRKPGEALWPEWQNKIALERIRHQPAMTERMWKALFQQEPVSESGNIVRRDWIKLWKEKSPPQCSFTIQTWDTALTASNTAAYSVCQTWGIFSDPDLGQPAMILLSRWRGRVEYPDLRKMATRLYFNYLDDRIDMPMTNPTKMQPDLVLVEDAPAGKPLISDLRRAEISVTAFPVSRYGNKDARLRLSLDIIENGRVYVPAMPPNFTMPRKFADEWITSMTTFPAADSRDDVDATSQAIIRLKTSGWIHHTDDPEPQGQSYKNTQREAIY